MRRRNRSLRFLDEEWAKITAAAQVTGQSVSAYMRGVLLRPVQVSVEREERQTAAVDAAGRPLNALVRETHVRGTVTPDERLADLLGALSAVLDDIEADS